MPGHHRSGNEGREQGGHEMACLKHKQLDVVQGVWEGKGSLDGTGHGEKRGGVKAGVPSEGPRLACKAN